MFDRSLLTKLSRCAWKVLNLYLTQAVPYDDAKAGAAIAVQSFGLRLVGQAYGSESDFQNFNSHLHVICTDGCFYGKGSFKTCPTIPNPKDLEDLFRYEVFKMLKSEGKINDLVIENMMNWPPARRALSLRLGEHHSGFNVYCGKAIWPHNEEGLENLVPGTCPP